MKKRKSIFIFLMLLIICLTGCSDNKTSDQEIKTKVIQELDYLDTHMVSILNKLNNISLQDYTITSEEISLGQENLSGSSGEGSNSDGTSSSQGEESGGQQKESTSQIQSGGETKDSNITITQMEPKTALSSDENDIDWNAIKAEIETVNESWAVILLDLSSLNVNNDDILGFSSTLDDCILSIKDENKINTLSNTAKLYSFIPKFESAISASISIQNIKQVKSYIINAYTLVEQGDWNGIEKNISECEKTFKNLTNDVEYVKDKEYKINRTYVLLKELQNSLSYKDKKLFYVKYKNLLENINTL